MVIGFKLIPERKVERADERAGAEEDGHGAVGSQDQRREGGGRRLHRPLPRIRNRHHRCEEDRDHLADCFLG